MGRPPHRPHGEGCVMETLLALVIVFAFVVVVVFVVCPIVIAFVESDVLSRIIEFWKRKLGGDA